MNKKLFIRTINQLRLENKNKWYYFNDTVEGKIVRIKGIGTWLQIYTFNGLDYSNCMGQPKVSEFKESLAKPFNQSGY